MSKFHIYKGKDQGDECWRWRLRDNNGENIADGGEGYRESSIDDAIKTLQQHAPGAPIVKDESAEDSDKGYRFEYYQGKDAQWYWKFRSGNNQTMADGEGYTSESGVRRGVENVRLEMGRASVVRDDD